MEEFIQKLPMDIVLRIIPYTYNFQNRHLLEDIQNYTESKKVLSELYHNFWIIQMQSENPQEDKNWLINDIFLYANQYNPTMFGYIDNFYNIFRRNRYLQTNEKIDKFVSDLEKKEVSTQINIFLGLFTANERNKFIYSFPEIVDII